MSGNFDDLDETHDNIDSQNSIFSPESKQEFIFEELLQELYGYSKYKNWKGYFDYNGGFYKQFITQLQFRS